MGTTYSVYREEDEVVRKAPTLDEAMAAIRADVEAALAEGREAAGPYTVEERQGRVMACEVAPGDGDAQTEFYRQLTGAPRVVELHVMPEERA